MWTTAALRTMDSRLVSGPRSVRRDGIVVAPRRDGVGVTIVISSPCAASAHVIPRMLGTIPPSRTGSRPLQRWTQPSRNFRDEEGAPNPDGFALVGEDKLVMKGPPHSMGSVSNV